MDIYFLGFTSFRLKGKKTTIVIDPFDSASGFKMEKVSADAVCLTQKDSEMLSTTNVSDYSIAIDGPGEYEVGGISITGIQFDKKTLYVVKIDDITVLTTGILSRVLTAADLERLPEADIVCMSVGGPARNAEPRAAGGADSIGPKEAAELATKFDAKIIIPMYYRPSTGSEKMKIQLETVDTFLKELGKEGALPQAKLSITKEKLPAEMEVVVLE